MSINPLEIDQSQLSPFEYYLFFPKREDIPTDFRQGDVGYFGHKMNDELQLPIYVSDSMMAQVRQTKTFLFCDEELPDIFGICLTNSFYREIQRNRYLISSLWHELGHYHTLSLFPEIDIHTRNTKAENIADLFSLFYTSRAEVSSSFKYLIEQRKKTYESDAYKLKAINELKQRQEYLKQFNSEKQFRKEILKLCKK